MLMLNYILGFRVVRRNLWLTGLCFSVTQFCDLILRKAKTVNQFSILIIRVVVGLAFATLVTRMFRGSIDPGYVLGLAAILVGLAYLAEYLRKRRTK